MNRNWTLIALLCLPAVFSLAEDGKKKEKAPALAKLAWLAGSWSSQKGRSHTEEHWIKPKGGMMLGVNRSVRGKKTSFEFLRIAATSKGIVYYASPAGRPPTPFNLVKSGKNEVTFENPKNAFPQRIIYRRKAGKLTARIEGKINGKNRAMEWVWTRQTAKTKKQ